ncbi:MAG: response regulator [Deltaproteobacteria bacterium]|nr:response regulator [Deltaproteobacteria bacterium]
MTANGSSEVPSIKLLLVDDEVAYVNVLAKRLAKRGFEVKSAVSGAQGIQAVRHEDFDVAVLDLKMEDIDGIEVLKIFKQMVPGMAVIMLTGHGSEQAAREGIRFGAFDYLTKPCELDELVEKILESYEYQKKRSQQRGPQ